MNSPVISGSIRANEWGGVAQTTRPVPDTYTEVSRCGY